MELLPWPFIEDLSQQDASVHMLFVACRGLTVLKARWIHEPEYFDF